MEDGEGDVDKNFLLTVENLEMERPQSLPGTPKAQQPHTFDTTSRMGAQEMRLLFISLLKASYESQVDTGELAGETLQAIALQKSLDFVDSDVNNGGRIEGT